MKIFKKDDFFLSDVHEFSVFVQDHQNIDDIHGHEFNELVIVKSGCGFHVLNGIVNFISQGDYFYIRTTDIHYYESTNNLSLINVLINDADKFTYLKGINKLLSALFLDDKGNDLTYHNKLLASEINEVETYVERIISMNDNTYDRYYFLRTESSILSLLEILSRKEILRRSIDKNESEKNKVISYFKHHYNKKLNIEELCNETKISKRTLYRFIKNMTGYTPEKLKNIFKLLKSKELLLTTDIPIAEISHSCGFSSPSRLSEAYSYYFGKTPQEERGGKFSK